MIKKLTPAVLIGITALFIALGFYRDTESLPQAFGYEQRWSVVVPSELGEIYHGQSIGFLRDGDRYTVYDNPKKTDIFYWDPPTDRRTSL